MQAASFLGIITAQSQPTVVRQANSRVLQTSQRYALTYDADGAITDLAGGMGLGLVYVRRSADAPSEYTVDLVSYERAVPVWRGVISIPSTQ